MAATSDTSATALAAAAPRLRQRKISVKQRLRILWERDLPDFVEDVRSDLLGITETGVDKSEEDERHLQAVLSASTVAPNQGKAGRSAYIPTPSASTKWAEYDSFYQPGWIESTSYIHSSATVEDALGCEYNMDEVDAEFLEELNKDLTDSKQKCSEDELEMLCSLFESAVAEKQPFLATDVSQLMPYTEMEPLVVANLDARRRNAKNPLDPEQLLYEAHSEDYAPRLAPSPYRTPLASVRTFGKKVYEHWRQRKIKAHGRSVFPSLKFETGLASDDLDPYVCFRRRELRHTRKTRRTDAQNSGRLRKLHSEMQHARSLVELVLSRERSRLQQIQTDFEIFEARCRVKSLKRKIGGTDDPELAGLLVSVPKRVRKEEAAKARREERERERRERLAQEKAERAQQQAASAAASASSSSASTTAAKPKPATPAAAGSRIPDLEHITVSEQLAEREALMQQAIAEKMRQRELADAGWVNLTENSLVPFAGFFAKHSQHAPSDDAMFSSIEYSMPAVLDNMRRSVPRIALPLAFDLPVNDTPEVLATDNEGTITRFGEVDFARDPNRFSVPRDGPQASLRRRVMDGVHYIDRSLTEPPLRDFAKSLATAPSSEADERLADRYRFSHNDVDYGSAYDDEKELARLFEEPARLNELRPATQTLRFGSMIMRKTSDQLQEAQQNWRRAAQATAKRQAQQSQAQQRLINQQQAQAQQQRAAQQHSQVQLRVQQAQKFAQKQAQRNQTSNGTTPAPGFAGARNPTPSLTPAGTPVSTSSSVHTPGSPAVSGQQSGKQQGNHTSNTIGTPTTSSSGATGQSGKQSGKHSGTMSGSRHAAPAQGQNPKSMTPQPPKIEAGG